MPVFVDNDATVAALAEAFDDELRPIAQTLVMLTVGTGVGGGIVIDGRIYRGATGAAAELGHMIIGADLQDGAPAPERAAAAGVARGARGRARARPPRPRAGFARRPRGRRGRQGAATATARDCLRILGERLGIGIANSIHALDPDLVVIGGGVSSAGELLLRARAPGRRGSYLLGRGHAHRDPARPLRARRPACAARRCSRARSSASEDVSMRVACGFDHAGVPLATPCSTRSGRPATSRSTSAAGTTTPTSRWRCARAVVGGDAERGIVVCGSGAGVAVAACKLPGIRADGGPRRLHGRAVRRPTTTATCSASARASIGPAIAAACAAAFVGAEFSGEERHVRRLGKVLQMESQGLDAPLDDPLDREAG